MASSSDATVQPFTVTGKVVNGLTGAAIPRALVTLNNRNALTNALGVFSFAQFQAATGTLSVTKPGFAQSRFPSGLGLNREIVNTTTNLEVKLFPDGIITGTVAGPDGLPLERIPVTIERRSPMQGSLDVVRVGFAQTDSHGSYRFEEPPGEYRLHLGYSPRTGIPGDVMLPLDEPEQGAEEKATMLKLQAGQELRVALRPRIGKGIEIPLKINRSDAGQGAQILVTTAQGLTFNVSPQNSVGDKSVIQLPTGSYHLRALQQTKAGPQEAEAQITVSERAVLPLELRFNPQPQIQVELVPDPPANSNTTNSQPPTLAQMNVRLEQAGARSDSFSAMVVLGAGDRTGSGTMAISPGTYRLRGLPSNWYVRAASYGTIDLLKEPLVIGTSGATQPIRLYCSNRLGTVSVTIRSNGLTSAGWVYLIALQPMLTPIQTIRSMGTAATHSLPPGRYTVFALDQQFGGDLSSSSVLEKVKSASMVEINDGQTTELEVSLQSAENLQ